MIADDDGELVVEIRGRYNEDHFGASVSSSVDFDSDGSKDLVIGAPRDGLGHVFIFYGPFDPEGPVLITADEADAAYFSPDPNDIEFGQLVGPVPDIDCDGLQEIRIAASNVNENGDEITHTYIIDPATGDAHFAIAEDSPFDPWPYVEGDVDGDADVDQNDIDIITNNQGRVDPDLTTYDGELTGDGRVDQVDLDIANGNFGANAYASIGIGNCPWDCDPDCEDGLECKEDCFGSPVCLPTNVEVECDPVFCPGGGCAITIDEHLTAWDFYDVVTLTASGPLLEHGEIYWSVTGAPVEMLSGTQGTSITFRMTGIGPVEVQVHRFWCGDCSDQTELFSVWIDSDFDGLPDGYEEYLGLNPYSGDSDQNGTSDADEDADNDGLNNIDELAAGSDPLDQDTDGDNILDGADDTPNDANGGVEPPCDDLIDGLWVNDEFVDTSGIVPIVYGDNIQLHATTDVDWTATEGEDLLSSMPSGWCPSSTVQIDGLGDITICASSNGGDCSDCITLSTHQPIQEQIECWIDTFWSQYDDGGELPAFDGTGMGIHQDWHPFDEVAQEYEDQYPGVPISDAVYGGAWDNLTSSEQQNFIDLSQTMEYESYAIRTVSPPGGGGILPPAPTPPDVPGCNHEEFYNFLKDIHENTKWGNFDTGDCLDAYKNYWDVISRCPKFDCEDYADAIGLCLMNQLNDAGYNVSGKNKKVLLKCGWFSHGVGHTIFGIKYCGYWYIIDGGSHDAPIGIVPDPGDGTVPLDAGTANWLRSLYDWQCDNFSVIPRGEWDPGTRPFWEGPPWFESDHEAARVISCLRDVGGCSDAEIAELIECSVPARNVDDVLELIENPPDPDEEPECELECQ